MAKNAIDELAVMVTANSAGLTAGLKQAERSLAQFRENVERAAGGPQKPIKPPKLDGSASKELRALRDNAKEAHQSLFSLARQGIVAGGAFLVLQAGVSGLADVFSELKSSVMMAAELEQNTLAFEVMLGSAERAKEMIADIRKFAATTPFQNDELTVSAKKLIAYGITAGQVLPTLRMLGDVSAATGKPIGELSFLYGTLASQQRAYTKDIYQFANAGIPIWEELAGVMKKTVPEVQNLVEEGKVGFPEVVKAFRRMTDEGGRYYDMTRRQGQTTAGVLEQAADAWKQAKMHFGGILIEELGIKDAARDFDGFMQRVRGGLDTLRPGIRFIGDSIKAMVQAGHEFGRVIGAVMLNGGGAFGKAFPGLATLAKDFRDIVTAAKDFRLDEEQVLRSAMLISTAIAEVFGMIAKETAKAALVIYDVVDDIRKLVEDIRAVIDALHGNNALTRNTLKYNPFKDEPKQFSQVVPGGPIPMPFGNEWSPPTPGESPAAIFARAKALYTERRKATEAFGADPSRLNSAHMKAITEAEHNFLSRFAVPGANGPQDNIDRARSMLLDQNALPPWAAGKPPLDLKKYQEMMGVPQAGGAPPKPSATPFRDALAKTAAGDWGDPRKAVESIFGPLIDAAKQRKLDAAAAAEFARQKELAGMAVLGSAFGELARSAQGASKEMQKTEAAWQAFSAEVTDRAGHIKKEFADPWKELQKELTEIKTASEPQSFPTGAGVLIAAPLINDQERDAATAAAIRRAAEKAGVGQHYQLPDAVAVGSQEDARILNRFRSGVEGPKTMEDLLRQIRDILIQQKAQEKEAMRGFNPVRVIDFNIW